MITYFQMWVRSMKSIPPIILYSFNLFLLGNERISWLRDRSSSKEPQMSRSGQMMCLSGWVLTYIEQSHSIQVCFWNGISIFILMCLLPSFNRMNAPTSWNFFIHVYFNIHGILQQVKLFALPPGIDVPASKWSASKPVGAHLPV